MRELVTMEDLGECLTVTRSGPVFIFKHSTACPISWSAHERVINFLESRDADCPEFYLVNVIEARPISNALAREVSLRHQSPQLILVQDGKAVWSATHGRIRGDTIQEAIENFVAATKE